MNMTQPAPKIKMGRRRLLAALPAVGIVGATSVIAAIPSETPIMALFREWQHLREEEVAICEAHPEDKSPEVEAAFERLRAVEERLFAEPATGMADWAYKACVANGFGDWGFNNEAQIWAEARALIGEAA